MSFLITLLYLLISRPPQPSVALLGMVALTAVSLPPAATSLLTDFYQTKADAVFKVT